MDAGRRGDYSNHAAGMKRRANFGRALASGYGTMAVNVIYTLLSVPIALSYLPTRDFGLWSVVSQVAGYLALIETGMSASISRLLIDHKDDKVSGAFGQVAKTGAMVTLAQGIIAAALGTLAAPVAATFANIPADLRATFLQLVIGQCLLFGVALSLKIYTHLLNAHQRYDIINYAQALSLVVMFLVQWGAFHAHAGVFSLLWSSLAGTVVVQAGTIIGGLRAGVIPPRGSWGRFNGKTFREIFVFGTELFVQILGWQLIGASQLVMISHFLGLEAAGIYAIATKALTLAQQIVWRVFDYSVAGLSEMVARGELGRLRARFGDLVVLSNAFSIAAGFAFATCNQAFIVIWTGRPLVWESINDWLLGGLLFAYTLNRVHGGLAWIAKDVRKMRYVYFVEGLVFVAAAILVVPCYGVAGVVATSIVSDFAVSGTYGLVHSARYLGLTPREAVRQWVYPSIRLIAVLSLPALAVWTFNQRYAPLVRLSLSAAEMGALAIAGVWMVGLNAPLRTELRDLLRSYLGPRVAENPISR